MKIVEVHPIILELVNRGIEVRLEKFTDKNGIPHGPTWAIGGFYKHGYIHLTPSMADPNAFVAHGRYGVLREMVESIADLISLNFCEWQDYERRGYNLDDSWAPLLASEGYIEEKTETRWVVKRQF